MEPIAFVALERLHFSVLDAPVAKARPRAAFNGGKPRIYTPTKTHQAEWRIRSAFAEAWPAHKPWTGPIGLTVTAWLRMPKSFPQKRQASALPVSRPDCDNYLKTVMDALNGVAFVHDSQVITVTCSKVYTRTDPPSWDIELALVAPVIHAEEAALDQEGAATPTRRFTHTAAG